MHGPAVRGHDRDASLLRPRLGGDEPDLADVRALAEERRDARRDHHQDLLADLLVRRGPAAATAAGVRGRRRGTPGRRRRSRRARHGGVARRLEFRDALLEFRDSSEQELGRAVARMSFRAVFFCSTMSSLSRTGPPRPGLAAAIRRPTPHVAEPYAGVTAESARASSAAAVRASCAAPRATAPGTSACPPGR